MQTLQKTFYIYQRDSFSSIFVSQVVAEYLSLFKLPQESLGGGQGISDNNYSYGFHCTVCGSNTKRAALKDSLGYFHTRPCLSLFHPFKNVIAYLTVHPCIAPGL